MALKVNDRCSYTRRRHRVGVKLPSSMLQALLILPPNHAQNPGRAWVWDLLDWALNLSSASISSGSSGRPDVLPSFLQSPSCLAGLGPQCPPKALVLKVCSLSPWCFWKMEEPSGWGCALKGRSASIPISPFVFQLLNPALPSQGPAMTP